MISKKVKEYISEHSFCSEYLFKDWESFLDLLYAEDGRVSSILWWDHCMKSQQSNSVGSGEVVVMFKNELAELTKFYKKACRRHAFCYLRIL